MVVVMETGGRPMRLVSRLLAGSGALALLLLQEVPAPW